MKTTLTLITLALAGTLAAQAQEEKPKREDRGPRKVPDAILKEYDKDGDGELSADERKTMREAMQAKRKEAQEKRMAEFDTDKDGKLSPDERKAMREAMQAKRKALVEKYDADKDGKLSREEIQTAREAGEELPMMGRGQRGQRGERGQRGQGRPNRPEPKTAPAGE